MRKDEILYREVDYDEDIGEVIRLINENLNLRHNRYLIDWKHIRNPFRKSKGMVATKMGEMVAVVFYIEYSFFRPDGEKLKIGRPVEGCVIKRERGQRIFKTIMKKAIKPFLRDYDLFFANPNQYSYPEFLKMGWKQKFGYYHYIGLINPFKSKKGRLKETDFSDIDLEIKHSHNYFISAVDLKFIKWRYEGEEYKIKEFLLNGHVSYIIYRIVKTKGIKSVVLCDFAGFQDHITHALTQVCKRESIYVVYYLRNKFTRNLEFLFDKKHKEAVIVYLENNSKLNDDLVFSLGDLEGKI